ncbi:MAG: hypothetical protein J6Z79_06315, partial [Clostridia bacterium]|nr:hypothetical protein [Clostridia bacterium]
MKRKLLALLLTLTFLLPLIPAGTIARAEEVKPEIYGASLSLENNIAVNFLVRKNSLVDAGFKTDTLRMTFSFRGEETTTDDYTWRYGTAETGNFYVFTFRGLTSKDMNEPITATLSAEKESGGYVDSEPITDSVVSYCRRALSLYSTKNPTLCTLIVDLLTYGAKSQLYFNHDTSHLATEKLTPSQLAMGTSTTPVPVSCRNTAYETVSPSGVIWRYVNLKLADSVMLQFFFSCSDVSDLSIVLRDENGQEIESFTGAKIERAGNFWRVCCDTITPDKMPDELFITAYGSDIDPSSLPAEMGTGELPLSLLGNQMSNTLRYSIESYAADAVDAYNDPDLNALLYAVLNYGASAKAYAEELGNPARVNTPTLQSQLDAIPVATPSTSDADLRQIVLDYYALQASVPWMTRDAFTYVYTGSATKDMAANTIYCGMPYSSAAVGLYKFLDYYDEDTGVLNNVWGNNLGNSNASSNVGLGNHCASSIYWAWARISTTISFDQTKNMTPAKGVYPVGDYEIDETKASFEDNYDSNNTLVEGAYNTRSICDDNGSTKMYWAYAKLKPGDAVVSYYIVKNGNTYTKRHHTRLVKEVDLKTNSGGTTIFASSSKITFYEQDSIL